MFDSLINIVGWLGYGLISLFNKFIEFLGFTLSGLFSLLPKSPFSNIADSIRDVPFLGYLNFIIPIGEIIAILSLWLVAIALWYMYQIVLRWIKAIE